MRILEQNRNRLIVRHVPRVALGAMLLLIGGGLYVVFFDDVRLLDRLITVPITLSMAALAWWFMPVVELVFDRREGVLTFVERRLFNTRERYVRLTDIQKVSLDWERHSEGTPSNRLVLDTKDGAIPLERGYGPVDRAGIRTAINDWLGGRPGGSDAAVERAG